MMEYTKIERLLKQTKILVENHKEIAALKGENFNVFSILKMERKENETHSAFIQELLNPSGSHMLGSIFLKLFLKEIEYKNIDSFDFDSAKTSVEYFIGNVDLEKKEGGRIDILVRDKNNQTISIENKIDAGDQQHQIERYVNFNKGNNRVYYLTKNGISPSDNSRGDLIENKDYFCISYKETIKDWLEKCLKESAQFPILRESIKQYLILIKKITNTMDDKQEKQLNKLMMSNYAEAEYIAANFEALKNDIRDSFRNEIIKKTQELINEKELGLRVDKGSSISGTYAQIWYSKGDKKYWYGVESFSGKGHHEGNLFIGVLVQDTNDLPDSTDIGKGWNNEENLKDADGAEIKLSDQELMRKLFEDSSYRRKLVDNVSLQIVEYIIKNPIFN